MNVILADTSGLYSLLNHSDHHHALVKEFYNTLPRRTGIVIIEYILVETMTLLRARGYTNVAIQFHHNLTISNVFSLHNSTPELEKATFDIFCHYKDKEWSYADCALLATANVLKIDHVFSFDRHIDQMGLQRTPV